MRQASIGAIFGFQLTDLKSNIKYNASELGIRWAKVKLNFTDDLINTIETPIKEKSTKVNVAKQEAVIFSDDNDNSSEIDIVTDDYNQLFDLLLNKIK